MPLSLPNNELVDKAHSSDELADLRKQLKQHKNQINHLKRDLKKARYRINALKLQKEKLLKKLKSSPEKNKRTIGFFKKVEAKK